ncbi:phosphoribosylanthranilate isomerase [Croceicoccus gelatinilyticus]|uniref:phosphoribosylanthranilate isomerase n=1 Tax=Croceicoccus gelatinilyticus TaxID=2835536 RepID=UPI001BD11BF8|nr:phosphoribosylanthranilate isomerase [Croceicoccus gelatinilyticus]MBS7668408.1 phosphoribosylanthranilate isomerase [Croceicoccus gelatinilyticus]
MATRIKICGIRDARALDAAIEARADYAGFVFYPPSPRAVSPREAAELAARADGRIQRVGLFVNATDEELGEAVEAGKLDVLQLHGQETPNRAAALRSRFGLPVWKALSIASAADITRASEYRDAADLVLFDAKTPKGTLPGGMGVRFDWSLLAGYRGPVEWGLAGGIDAANVAEAIASTGAPLVDVSSGVESEPGVKDADKIAAFCRAVRAA